MFKFWFAATPVFATKPRMDNLTAPVQKLFPLIYAIYECLLRNKKNKGKKKSKTLVSSSVLHGLGLLSGQGRQKNNKNHHVSTKLPPPDVQIAIFS